MKHNVIYNVVLIAVLHHAFASRLIRYFDILFIFSKITAIVWEVSAVHVHVDTVTHKYRNVICNIVLTSVYHPDVASTLPQSCLDMLESTSELIFLQTTSETLKRLLFVQTCLTILFSHFHASEYDAACIHVSHLNIR